MHVKGIVKWFNYSKGFGFIKPDSGDKDIFVHISEVEKANINRLNENDIVFFEVKEHKGRISAMNLKLSA